ncbi:MAG: ankyrin repeat domain-containing protein [Parashewanella sp.]
MLSIVKFDFTSSLKYPETKCSHWECNEPEIHVDSKQLTNFAQSAGRKVIIVTTKNGFECVYSVHCHGHYDWKISPPCFWRFTEGAQSYFKQKPLIEHLESSLNRSHELCDYIREYQEQVVSGLHFTSFWFAVERRGVNVNACCSGSPYITPLMEAVREGELSVVQTLLDKGALVNSPTMHKKSTPLHFAVFHASNDAEQGKFEIIELLLNKGADIHWENELKKTPFNLAQKHNFDRALTLLQSYEEKHNQSVSPFTTVIYKTEQHDELTLIASKSDFDCFDAPIFLRISANQWQTDHTNEFNYLGDGKYVLHQSFEMGEEIEFKVASKDWRKVLLEQSSTIVEVGKNIKLQQASYGGVNKVTFPKTARYQFTLCIRADTRTDMSFFIEQLTV